LISFLVLPIYDSWETFKAECGREKILVNNKKLFECSDKYIDKSVIGWSGLKIKHKVFFY